MKTYYDVLSKIITTKTNWVVECESPFELVNSSSGQFAKGDRICEIVMNHEIDELVNEWNDNENYKTLQEFLSLTDEEYKLFKEKI